jgi:hypothetical protein
LPSCGIAGRPIVGGASTIDLGPLEQRLQRINQIITQISQSPVTGPLPEGAETMPPLSAIDNALGGQALVALKTPLAIIAYAALWLMQSFAIGSATGPDASHTVQVFTAVIASLGGLGVSAKIDRALKATSAIAAAQQQAAPPSMTFSAQKYP